MAEERLQRRLAAILSADVVGYSSLMGIDEAGTLSRLNTLRRKLIDPAIAAHSGRIVKLMGDGALVEFASAVDAVAKDVLALDDNIADVDPDPEPDRADFGATGIVLAKLSLDFDGASDGVHGARELHQRAVAHELDDTARMAGDCRIDQLTPQGVQA